MPLSTTATRDPNKAIAQKVVGELQGDASKIAERLFPKTPPGMAKVSEQEFVGHVQQHWAEPEFRVSLLQRVGPRNFKSIVQRAFGEAAWPDEPNPTKGTTPAIESQPMAF